MSVLIIQTETGMRHRNYGNQVVVGFREQDCYSVRWFGMHVGLDNIEIVNSVPSDELQTAIHMREHVLDIRAGLDDPPWSVNYHRIEDKAALLDFIDALIARALATGSYPLLHLECHGWDDSITMANGAPVKWAELAPVLRRLNRATRNNLVVICAACKGFHAIKTIIGAITEGTAVRIVIGPEQTLSSNDLESAMKAMYSSFLNDPDLPKAVASAKNIATSMAFYRAEDAFIRAYIEALKIEAESKKSKRQQIEDLVSQAKLLPGLQDVPRLHDKVRTALKVATPEVHFDHIKSNFFMLDSFPELKAEVDYITLEYLRSLMES